VLTISEYSKSEIVSGLGIPAEKVRVTYLGAAPQFRPRSAAEVEAVRQKYGLDQFILTVCTLEPRKNLTHLFRAYQQLRQRGINLPLVHVGSRGWHYDEILAEPERLGIQSQVHFLGYVPLDDLAALYNAATVFVYPSLYEGFGLPVLEAMQCGCPVISSNATSLPEVAGEAAILVNPHDQDQMVDSLFSVITDVTQAQALRETGLKQSQLFSWKRCAEETLAAYHQALQTQ
jgi:glycosyltransferase involved in cell wall biosynthesis